MDVQPVVPRFDETQALTEGWSIFQCWGSENGPFQLQRVDEDEAFANDDDVWAFVIDKARAGSTYHKSALDYLRLYNPTEITWMTRAHGELP
jgi:hypothetical protein